MRQEKQIDVLYVSFNAWDSQVLSYTPFHFSFTVPLKIESTLKQKTYQMHSQLKCYVKPGTPSKCKSAHQENFQNLRLHWSSETDKIVEEEDDFMAKVLIVNSSTNTTHSNCMM